MNLLLLDPFSLNIPQVIQNTLTSNYLPSCISFDSSGQLLAAGTIQGIIIIWDLDTGNISKEFHGHASAVTSISFTNCSGFLLSSSSDWNCILWDLNKNSRISTVRFTSPVIIAQIHPQDHTLACAIAFGDDPYIINLDNHNNIQKCILKMDAINSTSDSISLDSSGLDDKKHVIAFSIKFHQDLLYISTTKGQMYIYSKTGVFKTRVKLTSGASITSFYFTNHGRDMVVNATDRMIRVFAIKVSPLDENMQFELQNKFIDSVDKNHWVECQFSADSDYVIGGSTIDNSHNIFIWDKLMGGLVKKLEGPKEGLVDMKWHPVRPIIASLSKLGTVFLWGVNYVQNFSAFAPSFTELEDNIEYQEREDEFDIIDDHEYLLEKKHQEFVNVDILT